MLKVLRFCIGLALVGLLCLMTSCGWHHKKAVQPAVQPVPTEEEPGELKDSIENIPQVSEYAAFLQIALHFEGVPYRAGTLEHADGVERLVVDTSAFDCMTLIESSMALYRMGRLADNERSPERYREILKRIRYRHGVLTDYTSRLHYGSEWIADNVNKGYLQDITDSIAGLAESMLNVRDMSKSLNINVHLMTSYPQRYETLRQHPEFTAAMIGIEQQVNRLHLSYIPKDMVVATNPFLPDGCIVAITTSMEGLDIVHFGIVCHVDGCPHLLHASSSAGKVTVSGKPLYEYLGSVGHFSGVILLKVL